METPLPSVQQMLLFSFMTETHLPQAIERATQLYSRMRKQLAKKGVDPIHTFVSHSQKIYMKSLKQSFAVSKPGLDPDVPVHLGPWLVFKKESDPEEFLSVLYVSLLQLPSAQVAEAMGVTEGTLRHRLARGLKTLGAIQIQRGSSGSE